MQKSANLPFFIASLLPLSGIVTGCGDMQQPTAVVEASKKKISGQDAATMDKLTKGIKSGFGERNPTVSSMSFDKPL